MKELSSFLENDHHFAMDQYWSTLTSGVVLSGAPKKSGHPAAYSIPQNLNILQLKCNQHLYQKMGVFTDWQLKRKLVQVASSTRGRSPYTSEGKQPSFVSNSMFGVIRDCVRKKLRTAGNTDRHHTWWIASTEALKTRWQGHPLQALVE